MTWPTKRQLQRQWQRQWQWQRQRQRQRQWQWHLENTFKEWSQRLMIFEIFDKRDEETWPGHQKDNDQDKDNYNDNDNDNDQVVMSSPLLMKSSRSTLSSPGDKNCENDSKMLETMMTWWRRQSRWQRQRSSWNVRCGNARASKLLSNRVIVEAQGRRFPLRT